MGQMIKGMAAELKLGYKYPETAAVLVDMENHPASAEWNLWHGETISTTFVESSVNYVVSKRFVKKQQMRWTRQGARLLLQTRDRF